jgi:hypothetical protein
MSKSPIYSLDIVNSEGPLVKIIKSQKSFLFLDQWKYQMGILSKEEVLSFLAGEIILTDSSGRRWRYPDVSKSMRTSEEKILNFIKDTYSIDLNRLLNYYLDEIDGGDGLSYLDAPKIIGIIVKILESNPEIITKNN